MLNIRMKRNSYYWRLAQTTDMMAMVALTIDNFGQEFEDIFSIDRQYCQYSASRIILDQQYNKAAEQVMVACEGNRVLAWSWITRNDGCPWSREMVADGRFISVDMTLPIRQRIRLIRETLQHWEIWARSFGYPIVCCTSILQNNQAFMRLHQQAGYLVTGTIAYKRVIEKETKCEQLDTE